MKALELLRNLESRGIEFQAAGDRLRFRPSEVLTPEDLDGLRQHKQEIVALLQAEASLPAGALGLLERLRKGASFLMDAHATLLETGERYTKLEARFLAGIDLWDSLDRMVRFLYCYQGCVLAPGPCPDDAPVRCRACAGMIVTETGEQRYE